MARGPFYDYLVNELGIDPTKAEKASSKYDAAISDLQAKASRASRSTSTGGSSDVTSAAINALGAGFIDMQVNNLARISTGTGKLLLDGLTKSASLNPITLLTGLLEGAAKGTEAVLSDIAELDKTLIERVRGSGGYFGSLAQSMMKSVRMAMIDAQDFGVATDDTIAAVKSLVDNSGRMTLLSSDTISNGLKASLIFTKNSQTLLENAENFRNVGIGLDSAAKSITEIGLKSVSLGLSGKATGDAIVKNIDKLNQYGFQNGIKGLGTMVQQAQSLKMNMEEIFKVADKLYDPESAINLAANLQVVGGAVGDLGDPIKLMYDATNNVESLQTSIIGAARSLATYNAEQGRFEVTGANLRRAKAMADALGISMGELTSMAVKGAAKFEAMSELDMFPKLTDEQKEFVANISTIKDGKVGFEVPKDIAKQMGLKDLKDGFVGLSELSDDQVILLQRLQQEAQEATPEKIAKEQYNQTTRILNVATAIYLRMMEDARGTTAAEKVKAGLDKAASVMEGLDPYRKSTGQTIKDIVENVKSSNLLPKDFDITSELTKLSPELAEIVTNMKEKIETLTENLDIEKIKNQIIEKTQDLYKGGKEKGRELINEGLEKLGIDLRVSVDINSNNTLLAGIIVDEIERTPQLKATLASSIIKSIKDYA